MDLSLKENYDSAVNQDSIHSTIIDLKKFKLEGILSNNTQRKVVCLKGSFDNSTGDALVILEKTAFTEENLLEESEFLKQSNSLKKTFQNDVYGDYNFFPKVELNPIKTTIIHPATNKHIEKFSTQNYYIINETAEIYKEIILPAIEKNQFSLQWVYNILEHQSEKERIVYEDPDLENGFILIPDMKWDGNPESLYLLAICQKRGIKSLRDLSPKHLGLLNNIYKKGTQIIQEKFGLDESQLRIFVHYQPSFYHLHVHFMHLGHEAPGILAERAHLLSNIISNISLFPPYYQSATISYAVRENDNLFKALEERSLLKKIVKK